MASRAKVGHPECRELEKKTRQERWATRQVTEVVRGADLLKSTARQLLLIRTLGYPVPAYFHCPLLRDEKNIRLAKRHDALSLRAMRAQGVKAEELRKGFKGEVG